MEPDTGFEPVLPDYKTDVLAINTNPAMVGLEGFEPPSPEGI